MQISQLVCQLQNQSASDRHFHQVHHQPAIQPLAAFAACFDTYRVRIQSASLASFLSSEAMKSMNALALEDKSFWEGKIALIGIDSG